MISKLKLKHIWIAAAAVIGYGLITIQFVFVFVTPLFSPEKNLLDSHYIDYTTIGCMVDDAGKQDKYYIQTTINGKMARSVELSAESCKSIGYDIKYQNGVDVLVEYKKSLLGKDSWLIYDVSDGDKAFIEYEFTKKEEESTRLIFFIIGIAFLIGYPAMILRGFLIERKRKQLGI